MSRKMRRRIREVVQFAALVLALKAFLGVAGTLGGIEQGDIELVKGAVMAAVEMAVFAGSIYLNLYLENKTKK